MANALDVARFFLATNQGLTSLKLQTLCACAQAVSCAYLGKKFFKEAVELRDSSLMIQEVDTAYNNDNSVPPLDLRPFSMEQRLILAGVNAFSFEILSELHGSNHTLTFDELVNTVQVSNLVRQLKKADKPFPEWSEQNTQPAENVLRQPYQLVLGMVLGKKKGVTVNVP